MGALGTAFAVGLLLTQALGGTAAFAAPNSQPRAMRSGLTHHLEHVGDCFQTRVKQVTTRLAEDDGQGHMVEVAGTGSAIVFADGHYNVAYQQIPAMDHSRPGDQVKLCVTSLPHDCPPGDTRGISYCVKNLGRGGVWRARDAEHECGGA